MSQSYWKQMKKTEYIDIVVIGNDHYNTLNVVRALGSKGLRTGVIIMSDDSKSIVLKSRWITFGNLCSADLAIPFLINKYATKNIRIPLIATDDASAALIDLNHDYLKRFFIVPSCKDSQGCLSEYMDKEIQLKYAHEAGFDIPFSIDIDLSIWSGIIPESLKFPCIVKPEKSIYGSKGDFRICQSKEELHNSLYELKHRISKVLVQDFIPNDEVILIGGVRGFNGDTYVFGEINKYKKGSKSHNLGLACMGVLSQYSSLRQLCIRLVDAMDYHGCFSIEILRPNKAASSTLEGNYFVEINLRTDGLYYFYTRGGINYPYIWYQCCKGENPQIKPAEKPIYGMNEFLYCREQLSFTLVKDLIKTDVFSLFDIHDIKPFISKILFNVKK